MRRPRKKRKKFVIPRTTVLIFIFAALSLVLIHRLFSLQIIHGQEYADNFSIMTTKTRTLKSTRGNIYDRNGQVLASVTNCLIRSHWRTVVTMQIIQKETVV